tara:strand:- start:6381 stop:9716 length:3336 start_codon:yes stop_codon:yes gene_type:complete
MSCKDILPQVKIDGIAIKQLPSDGFMIGDDPRSFSYEADETYDIGISHTNMIQVDSFLGAFSFGDLLNATVDTPSLYNVKFLFTDDPQMYKVVQDAIKLIDEVSFFLHGDGQTATTTEIKDVQSLVENAGNGDKPPVPPSVEEAVHTLNKCTFKMVKKEAVSSKEDPPSIANATNCNELLTAFSKFSLAEINNQNLWTGVSWSNFLGGKWEKFGCEKEPFNKAYNSANALANPPSPPPPTPPPTPAVKTLVGRVIDALTDNSVNKFTPTQDKLFSFVKSLQVDQKKITYQGDPLVATVTNSQITEDTFYDTQLKNLYMIMVPNIEYREDNKLIFTVRQYVTIPLVIDFQPQPYGTTTNGPKEVSLDFIKQDPEISTDKMVGKWTKTIQTMYGEKAYNTFIQNAKPKALFSEPITSIGYNGAINGTFFVSMKNLGEKLTVFGATLEQPQLYKGIIESVSIKKVYDDGTEVQLPTPTTVSGLSFKENMVRGYRFIDQYDLKNFKYVVSIDAKNPLEKLLQYVMPKLIAGKDAVDYMIQQLIVAKKSDSLVILNPVSGYFTDDFLGSSNYTGYNKNFVEAYQVLYNIYNFLLPGEPFQENTKKLVNTQQLLNLEKTYNDVINTMQVTAQTEGINLPSQASFSTKKKSTKKVPYKTLSQTFMKSYTTSPGPVLFDFLYAGKPADGRDGFIINKTDLLSRVLFEGQLLNSFGISENDNTYAATEPISITPLSIRIDEVSIDLTNYESLDELEDTTTNVLLAAEVEVKKPSSVFKGETNTFVQLLELENATVVVPQSKILKASAPVENFFPLSFPGIVPQIKAKKQTSVHASLIKMFEALAKTAKEELGKETAKALFLNEANAHPLELAVLALTKLGWYTGNAIDPKHSLLNRDIPGFPEKNMFNKDDPNIDTAAQDKAAAIIAPFYKQAPATVITRFMNSYQLEYVADFDLEPFKPVYKPLTKSVINGILPNSSIIAVLKMKAGAPIAEGYTEMHESFMIGEFAPLPPLSFTAYDFLPDIKISNTGILSPSSVKTEQISKGMVQQAKKLKTVMGGANMQDLTKTSKTEDKSKPKKFNAEVKKEKKKKPSPSGVKVNTGGAAGKIGNVGGGGGGGYF